MERLFDLDMQLLADSCLTLIAVFVLVLVASNLLFNPVRKFMNDRRERIRSSLEDAKRDQQDAAALKAEYEKKLADVEKEAELILADARKKAVENQKRIEEEARAEARGILEQARREAELEKSKAADEVKQQMIEIASLMAGKALSGAVDVNVQAGLVEETLKEMGESTWLS